MKFLLDSVASPFLAIQNKNTNELVGKHELDAEVYQKILEIANGNRGDDLNEMIRLKVGTVYNTFRRFDLEHEKLKDIRGVISANNVECEVGDKI